MITILNTRRPLRTALIGLAILSLGWVMSRMDAAPDNDLHLHQRAIFYYSITALLLGAQFISIGFLAELMTGFYARDSVPYSVCQRTHPAEQERE